MQNRPPLPIRKKPIDAPNVLKGEVLNRPPLPPRPKIPALDPSAMKVEVPNRPPLPKGVPPLKFGVEVAPKVVEPPIELE